MMKGTTLTLEVQEINPLTRRLKGSVNVPGSKSLTNRALLIAALAKGKTTISNALFSDDTIYLAEALQTLGFKANLNKKELSMQIEGQCGRIPKDCADLFIGNAGTAARFLTAFLTLGNGRFTLDGDKRMRERPIANLVDALNQLGADIRPASNELQSDCLPIRISASGLKGGKIKISGDVSSQFLSALLISTPYAFSSVEIELTTNLSSKPYVQMTLGVMAEFGVEVSNCFDEIFRVNPSTYNSLSNYSIESDASAASYFFAAPAICGGSVRVVNINRNSKQGDIKFVDILTRMGCIVTEFEDSIEVAKVKKLSGIDINMRDIPDIAQTLAVIAPFASSPTRIRGIASARKKETDRISATCTELRKLGVPVDEHEDGMTIFPSNEIQRSVIKTYNDHRMAMAFSLIGLHVPGIKIENPSCVSKTFPNYFEVLASLK